MYYRKRYFAIKHFGKFSMKMKKERKENQTASQGRKEENKKIMNTGGVKEERETNLKLKKEQKPKKKIKE